MRRKLASVSSFVLMAFSPGLLATPSAPPTGSVVGSVTLMDDGGQASDVATSVVWLESDGAPAARPETVSVITSEKQFSPRIIIVPVGSTVSFPNNDPFNHNVFSRTSGAEFDLGLYSRGTERSTRFPTPGIVRIYCNVHPEMSAVVVVMDHPYFTQPGNDGSFSLEGIPPGRYTLHAWHERASERVDLVVDVPEGGLDGVNIELDARGYRFEPHLNKYGRPYSRRGRRY